MPFLSFPCCVLLVACCLLFVACCKAEYCMPHAFSSCILPHMEQITLVLDNIRSAHNVGAILRSAVAFGVKETVCLGVTPYPKQHNDQRLPHVANQAHKMIAKTALGAETLLTTYYLHNFQEFFEKYSHSIIVLEQSSEATMLPAFHPETPCSLVIGNEVEGVSSEIMERCGQIVEIPHTNRKKSINVATASGIALYDFYTKLEHSS